MNVVWGKRAHKELLKIEDYILRRFGKQIQERYIMEVDEVTSMLASTPQYGRIDPLFSDYKIPYRSVIIRKLSKLIYYIDGETIHIAAIWDTRKDPVIQSSGVEEFQG